MFYSHSAHNNWIYYAREIKKSFSHSQNNDRSNCILYIFCFRISRQIMVPGDHIDYGICCIILHDGPKVMQPVIQKQLTKFGTIINSCLLAKISYARIVKDNVKAFGKILNYTCTFKQAHTNCILSGLNASCSCTTLGNKTNRSLQWRLCRRARLDWQAIVSSHKNICTAFRIKQSPIGVEVGI